MDPNNYRKLKKQMVQEACDEVVHEIEEQKDWRPSVQCKKIAWKAFPKSVMTSISTRIDNTMRNFAYHVGVSQSSALDHFFETIASWVIAEMDKLYPQRPKYNDWRAYRWHCRFNKLTKSEKRKDEKIKRAFNRTYGRNKPFYNDHLLPGEAA